MDVASLSLELVSSIIDSANLEDCSSKHGIRGGRGGVGDPCNHSPCQNGGDCIPTSAHQYMCSCLEGYRYICYISLVPQS